MASLKECIAGGHWGVKVRFEGRSTRQVVTRLKEGRGGHGILGQKEYIYDQ